MTVVMLSGFSVMTRTYSCCLSTGHGAVIYRIVSPSRWRSGTVLSEMSMPHAPTWGAPFAHSCLGHMQSPAATPCPTLSARVRLQCWREWRRDTFRDFSTCWERKVHLRKTSWQSGSSSSWHCMANRQVAPWRRPATICTLASRENLCVSCHCRRQTWISSSAWNELIYRCYYGRQPTSWVLRTFPSQNMAGRSKTG